MTASHAQAGDGSAALTPELVAPLVSMLVRPDCTVNGQVLVAAGGWARRSTVVECEPLVRIAPTPAADASTQLQGAPLHVAGSCRDFQDALASYDDFKARVVGHLRQP